MTTESQRYNFFTRNEGNAIPKHAGPEAKGSNPTAGLTLLWVRNPFRGNFNHWQVSRKEAGQVLIIMILTVHVSTTVFITQGNYVGYMFRLLNSHFQAYSLHVKVTGCCAHIRVCLHQ